MEALCCQKILCWLLYFANVFWKETFIANRTMCQRKVDVDMLNAVKSVLADVSSIPLKQFARIT